MTAAELKAALHRYYAAKAGEWVTIEEALDGWANMYGGIDLLALGVWRSARVRGLQGQSVRATHRAHPRVSHEIKVDRGDFRKELYGYKPGAKALASYSSGSRKSYPRESPPWPEKQLRALALADFFVFVVPKGLLHEDEIARYHPWGDKAPRPGALYVPAGCGLWEVDHNGVTVARAAPPSATEPGPLTRHETHELLRKVQGYAVAY